jgi:phospholipid/cholesterol/gamma-HCH transport system substrate-binding protein
MIGARRATAFAAVALVATSLSACNLDPRTATLPGGVATGDDGYTVTAVFSGADNLVPNSEVQYQNVRIGTVRSIELDHQTWHALVKISLLKSVELPADVHASIGQKSLLGAEFVQITTPTSSQGAGHLEGNDVIPLRRTQKYPETEDVLAAVSLLFNNGGLAELKTITTEVNRALDRRVGTARDLLHRLSTFVGGLNDQKQELLDATASLDRLAGQLARHGDIVARALTHITPAVSILNHDKTKLTTALAALDRLGVVATRILDQNRGPLATNLALLKPVLAKLAEAGSAIPKSLPLLVSFPFPITTLFKAVKGDYMNLFEMLDLSISSIRRDFLAQLPVVGRPTRDTVIQARNPITAPLGPGVSTRNGGPAPTPKVSPTLPSAPTVPLPSTSLLPGGTSHTPAPKSSSCALLDPVLGGC